MAPMAIQGFCEPRFTAVGEEFERNFALRGEVGAAVTVIVDGEPVVDLHGGVADPESGRPWTDDTLVHVWSCTKGATALCAHILAARGELDVDAPVVDYWPEFAKNGKERVLVRHLLAHQTGLPAVRAPLAPRAFCDWAAMTEALAAEEPFWEPGTRHGYHALTFGFLVGEVVRRVSRRPLGEFFRTEVAEPLGLDFWMDLPAELEPRVAPVIPADMTALGDMLPSLHVAAMSDPSSLPGLMLFNNGGLLQPGESDSRAAHAAVIGAIGGITDARGLAGMYRPLALGGAYGDVRLVDEGQIAIMNRVVSASGMDAVLQVPTRWTLGFAKAIDNRYLLPPGDREGILLSDEAFGHSGLGGSIGFADPRARLSFGYVMNQQGPGLGINDRGQSLVDATYQALGYRRPSGGGIWYVP
jgi:CubicO group peptidase (beta-lactamase class C family)